MGQGPRPVLALHCTLAYSRAWAGMVRHAGEAVTFIAPDMPNHGHSPDLDAGRDFADTVLAAALSCLDVPMDVIGHSFGGLTALRIAVERPDLVRTLTVIEPVLMAVAKADDPEAYAELMATESDFTGKIEAGDWAEAARAFNRAWGDGRRWADLGQGSRDAMVRAVRVLPAAAGVVYDDTSGIIPRLGRVRAPCLLIRGSDSPAAIRTVNAGLARRLPDAREAVIAGAGHMAPMTHSAETADLFMRFLKTAG